MRLTCKVILPSANGAVNEKYFERLCFARTENSQKASYCGVTKNSSRELFFGILLPYDCPTKALLLTLLWN